MEKFKGKYRISSTRLQTWDYGWNGLYFITICTKNKEHYFGEIVEGKMQLSHLGILADVFWYEIKNHTQNIELHEFVVMPNHVHGILLIDNNNWNDGFDDGVNKNDNRHQHKRQCQRRDKACLVSTNPHKIPNKNPKAIPNKTINTNIDQTIGQKRFQNQGKNTISSIIGGYKSAVTKHAHRLGYEFAWQSRFYDHIIRDDRSYNRITEYIITNPQNWQNDKFYGLS